MISEEKFNSLQEVNHLEFVSFSKYFYMIIFLNVYILLYANQVRYFTKIELKIFQVKTFRTDL